MSTSGINIKFNKGLTTSAWVVYILIVFEILYMISPFAVYYYSIYSAPLKILHETPATSWLTVHLLPHFTYQTNPVISVFQFISWPLISVGLLLFLIAFTQIYWSKLMRKTTVTRGLYRYIRHPQYLALAIVGLGTTIFWPRFIVFIMYAVMLFLYYYLARQEEKICIHKFGSSYHEYLEKTGMFLPKFIEDRLPALPSILPEKGVKRIFSIIGLLIIYLAIVIAAGVSIKNYALSKVTYQYSDNQVVLSVAPLSQDKINAALSIALSEHGVKQKTGSLKKQLIYILPTGWYLPELGIKGTGLRGNYLLHPETHGNTTVFDETKLTLLITEPMLPSKNIKGKDILKYALTFTPIMEVMVDLDHNRITGIKERSSRGRWDGIPVPIY